MRFLDFPLEPLYKSQIEQQMMWKYGRLVIDQEDFLLLSKPQWRFFNQVIVYSLLPAYIYHQHSINPENVFKRFVLSRKGMIFSAFYGLVIPTYAFFNYWQRKKRV
mmetsp:Transcript_2206/g.3831  ORF Transcript_2206/g.3831 Transcript_2206/m.3831 type:complete len:106 (-) Transcript_2206:91-408(-)